MTQAVPELEKLDAAIAALESKLIAFRSLREVLANVEAAAEVRNFFAHNGTAETAPRNRTSKIMQKMEELFAKAENEWLMIDEIVAGTKLRREQVRQAIYKGHAQRFERKTEAGGGRAGYFRLKKQGG